MEVERMEMEQMIAGVIKWNKNVNSGGDQRTFGTINLPETLMAF